MKQLTWQQRTAASRNHPLVLILIWGIGLAIIGYSLTRYGFSSPILHGQLLIGLCFGLVDTLYLKWLHRRYLRYDVDRQLGLRSPDTGIMILQMARIPLIIVWFSVALGVREGEWRWSVLGAFLFAAILLYPEMKALHEGIKAKLAEMENTPEPDATNRPDVEASG